MARAARQPCGGVGDGPQAEHAGPALRGALAGHEVEDPGRRPDAALVARHDVDDAAAEARPGAPQDRGIEGRAPRRVAGDPAAEVAAEQHGAAGGLRARVPGELPERGADLDLGDAGARRPAHGHERRAGGLRAAGAAVPGLPGTGDQGDVRERLDVLDEGRPAVDAALEGSRRDRRGPRVALVHVVDRGRLLARDVPLGRGDQLDGDARVEPGPASRPLGQRTRDGGPGGAVRLADVEDDAPRTDRGGRELGAVEHEVRPAGHEDAVLGAERLALGAVDEHDRVAAGPLGDGRPLARDREPGAAATEEAGGVELRDQRRAPWPGPAAARAAPRAR